MPGPPVYNKQTPTRAAGSMLHAKSPSSVRAETLSLRNIFPDLVLREPIRPSPVRATRPVTELLDPLVRLERLFQRERCYRSEYGVHLHAFLVSEQRLELLWLRPVGDWEHFSLRVLVFTISRDFRKVDVLAIGVIRRRLRRFAGASAWCAMGLRWAGSVGRLCKGNLATSILGHVHRVTWSLGLASLENRRSWLCILTISIHRWLLSRFLNESICITSLRSTITYLANVRLADRRRHCWPHRRMVFFIVCPPPLSFARWLHCTRFSSCSAVARLLLLQSSLGRLGRVGCRWIDCSAKNRSQSRGWTTGPGSLAVRRLRSGLIRVARSLHQLTSISYKEE